MELLAKVFNKDLKRGGINMPRCLISKNDLCENTYEVIKDCCCQETCCEFCKNEDCHEGCDLFEEQGSCQETCDFYNVI